MKSGKFRAEVQAGHKEPAVEVPFDPEGLWGSQPTRIKPGRLGHAVQGTVNGQPYSGFIVTRRSKRYLVLTDEILKAAGAEVGAVVEVDLRPRATG